MYEIIEYRYLDGLNKRWGSRAVSVIAASCLLIIYQLPHAIINIHDLLLENRVLILLTN